MKNTITRIAALLLAFSMIFALAACKDKTEENDTTAAAGEVDNTAAGVDATGDGTQTATGDTSDVSGDLTAPAETETDKSGNVVETKGSSSSPVVAPPAGNSKPSTAAEVLKYYNDVTAAAVKAKVGFKKNRVTGNEKMDSNAIVEKFEDQIYKFIGIGAANAYNETVTKGQWETDAKKQYLRASTLSTGDIKSATCTQSGDNYVLTIKIKDGNTYAAKGVIKNNAPLDKCGINCGDEDKHYYDHKRASTIYDAIDEVFSGAVVNENYKNAVVTATVNASTGKIVSIVIKFDINVKAEKIMGMSVNASGTSTVTYSNFVY